MRLPNFIVGGALKTGTTSLNYYLDQHPDVYMSPLKEPRYFAYDPADPTHANGQGLHFPVKTLEQYAALFDGAKKEKAIGEVSPHYIISPVAPRRIKEAIPDVKLIFSLRNPIKRAYSVYWQMVRLGQEDRPVEEALTEAEHRVRNGRYYSLLRNWYDVFDPARIKVILFEDLAKDALGVFQDICRYLAVDDTFVPDLTIRNKGGALKNKRLGRLYEQIKKSPLKKAVDPLMPAGLRDKMIDARNQNFEEPPPIPPAVADRLQAYYRDDIEQLEAFLGRDLTTWKN
jgi:hypothetical protein